MRGNDDVSIPCSWSNRFAHITRPGKKIKRCQIKELVFHDNQIALKVYIQVNGVKKKVLESPISIASLQVHWLDGIVCSDDDEDQEGKEVKESKATKEGFSVPVLIEPLPKFEVLDRTCIPMHLLAPLDWITAQTNNFLTYRFAD